MMPASALAEAATFLGCSPSLHGWHSHQPWPRSHPWTKGGRNLPPL